MKVLVCGGRDYADFRRLSYELDKIQQATHFTVLITGGARGADRLAERWAKGYHDFPITIRSFPADWAVHGRSAGYIRNRRMLLEGQPDLVVAFPGGRGTAMMIKLAREANVKVIEIESSI